MSKKSITIISLILFVFLVFRFIQFYEQNPPYHDGEHVLMTTTLQAEPTMGSGGQKFTIQTPTNQLISVTTDAKPLYHYGQVLQISGKLQAHTFQDGQTILSLYHPDIILQRQTDNAIAAIADAIKSHTETVYTAALPEIPANLLMGIVFGAKEQFPSNFWSDLQATGVLHVIAASGMNVTFVSAALLYTLGLFLRRQTALVIGSLGIIFYIFLVGFQPSILRASIMGLLAFGAGILGRQYIATVSIFVSGYLLLLWQPSYLFNTGFQLSFLATLGIMFLKPLLDEPLEGLGVLGELGGESFTTTLAAELGTLPILLGVFGQIGLLSVLVNALVLWTIPILMIFGSIAAVVGLISPFFGELFLYPILPLLVYFQSVVSYFGQSNWVVHVASLPFVLWIGYYCLLAALVFFQKKKVKTVIRQHGLTA